MMPAASAECIHDCIVVQVTRRGCTLSCTCETFRIQAGSATQKCLHTKHIQEHAPVTHIAVPSEGVIPIRPVAFSDVQPYAYWVDKCLVTVARLTQHLRCSHAMHRTRCEHVAAVKSFIQATDEHDGDMGFNAQDEMQVMAEFTVWA